MNGQSWSGIVTEDVGGKDAELVAEPAGGEDLGLGTQGEDGVLDFVFGANGQLVVGAFLAGFYEALRLVEW